MADKFNNPFETIDSQLQSIKSELENIKNVLASKSQSEKKYYSIKEAADKLQVAEITLYRGGQSGKIPTKRIGSRLMVPGSFVDNQ
ncbi:MAG: helix-turn-helix domain-containing protein [Chryseotalea sp.]|jgi:hypothetical protein